MLQKKAQPPVGVYLSPFQLSPTGYGAIPRLISGKFSVTLFTVQAPSNKNAALPDSNKSSISTLET